MYLPFDFIQNVLEEKGLYNEGGGLSDTPDMGKDLARIRKEVYLKKLGLADRIDYIEKCQLNNSILKEYYLILNNKLSWLMYRLARKIAKIWH